MADPEWFARFDVVLPAPIEFVGWLPRTPQEALRVDLGDGMRADVWVPCEEPFVEGAPKFSEGYHINCHGFRILVYVSALPDAVRCVFEDYNWREEPEGPLAAFLASLNSGVRDLINRICSYVRDELGQFQVERLKPHSGHQFFIRSNAEWSWDATEWQYLRGNGEPEFFKAYLLPRKRCLAPNTWRTMAQWVNARKRTAKTLHFVSNARQCAAEGDYRSAVINAAIALEIEAKALVKEYLSERSLPKGWVSQKHTSTHHLVTVWLPLVRPEAPADTLAACERVLNLRNALMHEGKRQVLDSDSEAIWETARAVEKLWHDRTETLG